MSVVNTILTKVFGSNAERELKKMWPIVETINELEPSTKALSPKCRSGPHQRDSELFANAH